MRFTPTEIPEVIVIEPHVFEDSRGFFFESWNAEKLRQGGLDLDFVQDNHSKSALGTLRGLHYQLEKPQGKLARVTQGTVFDVAVDLRSSSSSFGRWIGVELSASNRKMLWVPPGFAHGFYVVSETAEFCYKCTEYYSPADERTILWNDPDLGIDWPACEGASPILSVKDQAGSTFRQAETYP